MIDIVFDEIWCLGKNRFKLAGIKRCVALDKCPGLRVKLRLQVILLVA